MKEKLRIHGGARLEGEVTVSGGKNAAVAILPAALLGDSPSVIENVPDINDVHIILDMLAYLGAQVEFRDNVVTIDPRTADKFDPPYDLACQMRASYYFAPVLLGRFHRCEVPLPGGCDLGLRPIDQTLKGMRALGVDVDIEGGMLETNKVKAFRVPAGVPVEVWATTLHFAPCHTDARGGFRVAVALPKGTNTDKPDFEPKCEEDLWMTARNKWLLAHPASRQGRNGAHIGLKGENIDIEEDI